MSHEKIECISYCFVNKNISQIISRLNLETDETTNIEIKFTMVNK